MPNMWIIKFLIGTEMYYDKWPAETAAEAARGWRSNLHKVADDQGFVDLDLGHGSLHVKVDSLDFVEAHR